MRSVPRARISALCLSIVAAIVTQTAAQAQSTLIPLLTRRDMVFDHSGRYLYVTTSDGWVRPYNLLTRQLEPGYSLGGSLNGVDIASDDSFLLIAQGTTSGSEGTFHRLNLNTGVVTNINYTRDSQGEMGGWDVAIASNGLALVTTACGGGCYTPLRQINLSTNAVSIRSVNNGNFLGYVAQNTQIHRSADRTRLSLLETNFRTDVYTYDSATDTLGPVVSTKDYAPSAAINRNGSVLGIRRRDFASLDAASDFSFRHSFSGLESGVAFDALHDLFYAVNCTTDQVVAYDTNTFAERFRLVAGEDLPPAPPPWASNGQFETGTLVVGRWPYLDLHTHGIRVIRT